MRLLAWKGKKFPFSIFYSKPFHKKLSHMRNEYHSNNLIFKQKFSE